MKQEHKRIRNRRMIAIIRLMKQHTVKEVSLELGLSRRCVVKISENIENTLQLREEC